MKLLSLNNRSNKFVPLLLCVILLSTCHNKEQGNNYKSRKQEKKTAKSIHTPKAISIYRLGSFSQDKAEKLEKQLKEYYPNVSLKEESITLPIKHYNSWKNRYRASGVIEELAKHHNQDVVLGLTDKVIFISNEKSPTYGVMGYGRIGWNKCVASTIIPKTGKEQTADNFCKLALHELGHAFGLKHCQDQHCYMVAAEHGMKFPQTTDFCPSCKVALNAKGWTIN